MEYPRTCFLLSGVIASAGQLYGKDNFWTKPADQWTDKEVHQLLTKSPWAKAGSPPFGTSGRRGPRVGGGGAGGWVGAGRWAVPRVWEAQGVAEWQVLAVAVVWAVVAAAWAAETVRR